MIPIDLPSILCDFSIGVQVILVLYFVIDIQSYSMNLRLPGGLDVKRLSTMWETWVRSLGREDPLEKEMAIHSSTIAWKIP